MRKYKNVIVIALIMSFLFVQVTPRRAEAVIPGIAAAAAALGCSEGTLVAVGGALLTAGGIVAAGESEKVKAVSAAVAGLGSAALERLSEAVNAVGPGGQFTLPIDELLASTIGEMVQNVEDVAASGEPIELKEIGPETVLESGFGRVELDDSTEGVLLVVFEHTAALYTDGLSIDLGYSDLYKVWLGSGYDSSRQGHVLYWNVGLTGISSASGEIDFCSDPYPYETGTYGEHTLGIGLGTGGFQLWVDGLLVHQVVGDYTESLNFDGIWSSDNSNQAVHFPLMYSYESTLELPLLPEDYTNAGLTAEQIAALAGTTITGDVVTNVYNPPVINPPVTWPVTPDLNGILEALKNLWNSIIQGFAGLGAKVAAIPAAIAVALQGNPGETINWEPIKSVGIGLTTAFPFSLPWDVQRIFSSLNGAEWNGVAEINVEGVLAKFDFDINIEQWFGSIRPIVKTAEVICFDLALILATRKLLGGAQ